MTANGQEIDIFKHSYFITDAQIEDFVISGVPLTIHKPEIEPPVEESYTIAVYTGHLGRSFHFASSGTFEYRGDGPTKEGVYEKTEAGNPLYEKPLC